MIVLDASVIAKWIFVEEPYHLEARHLLTRLLAREERIVVPDLLFYEIANTLATKPTIPSFVAVRSIRSLYEYDLDVHHATADDVIDATRAAKRFGVTVYDMLYAVVAKRMKTVLVTADERFVKKTKFPFVKLLASLPSTQPT
jgi:predicted nucleic acid-binding protein